jgi:Arc/MetJ family transcription regulator
MRIPKTITVDESVLAEVERTKGSGSTSERVNELLKLALEQERRDELEREAARFYAGENRKDRTEDRAFQKASLRSFTRE